MIEIRITIDTALTLLVERMKFELELRQKRNLIKPGYKLENLSYKELMKIVEVSIFDTVFLLPVELINSETNLIQIVTKTVHALAKALNREEFILYTQQQAQKLIQPIYIYIQQALKDKTFTYN